jgi:hypothetical protein
MRIASLWPWGGLIPPSFGRLMLLSSLGTSEYP